MTSGGRLARYAAAREALLHRVTSILSSDERVVAAWLSGSFGRGEGDEWADYDLHLAIEDDALASFLAGRRAFYESVGRVSLVQDEIPGQPDVGERFHLVNFATPVGPVEVDFSFLPLRIAAKPIAHVLLFEKRPVLTMQLAALSIEERAAQARVWAKFFWAMAPIAARFCGRGDTRRAVTQVGLLSRALICSWRLLEEKDGPHPWLPDANRPLEDAYEARLPKLPREVSPSVCLGVVQALCREAAGLQDQLRSLHLEVDALAIEQTEAMISTARAAIKAADFRPRKYR